MADEKVDKSELTSITPVGRFCFPHVWEPFAFKAKPNEAQKEAAFSVILVMKPEDFAKGLSDLKRITAAAARNKFGEAKVKELMKKGKFGMPWRKCAETDFGDDYGAPFDEDGAVMINAKSRNPPGIVDGRVKPILNQQDFYAGCYGRISVYAHAYDTNGNKGVTFFLNNVQKTANGEKLAGAKTAPEDEFSAVAGADTDDSDEDNLF